MEWIANNWSECLAVLYIAERVVKHTATPYDDIVVDMVWSSIKKVVGK